MNQEQGSQTRRRVFLFSGHMIDAPIRMTPRFPPDKEPIAKQALTDLLTRLDAGPQDLAICGGACGETSFSARKLSAEARLSRSTCRLMSPPSSMHR